ncbi:MAG: prolipoprotein diacylglyceryl transferase [Lentimicrobiaceae bacterium]|nr:prolipoprotein diacylglyceryl transferase [Lentimicrobiaceae bacterium]
MLNYIVWNVNPAIFHIGNLEVRWYGLLFAFAFYAGYVIMLRFFKKENVPVKVLDSLTYYMIFGTVIGARLGHVFFYEADWYLSHPLEIIQIWKGGLASHGAAVGILIALYLFCRKHKKTYFWILDRIVIVVALAGVFIRTGNLMNSEIFGNPTGLPWAFIFIRDNDIPRHPTQIYEALSYLILFFILLWYYYKKKGAPQSGIIFSWFLIGLFSVRFQIEFLKVPQVEFEKSLTLNLGQSLSIPFIALGIGLLVWIKYHKPSAKS